MKARKRRKLEAGGWSVGSADNFLGDQARQAAAKASKLSKLGLRHYTYGGHSNGRAAWLVVHNPQAGFKDVYTVYRIELTGMKEAHVIGRELPLALARDVVRRDMESPL